VQEAKQQEVNCGGEEEKFKNKTAFMHLITEQQLLHNSPPR